MKSRRISLRSRGTFASLALTLCLLGWGLASRVALAEDFEAVCSRGCMGFDKDKTPDILPRKDEKGPVTIKWIKHSPPVEKGYEVRLYAGNPSMSDTIPDRGQLEFKAEGKVHYATREFDARTLGRGTFITVLTKVKTSGFGKGKEEILDWRAWRLLTEEEHGRELAGPPPATRYELDVRPSVLRARAGDRFIPRGMGGDKAVWFSLVDAQDSLSDVDLDGEVNGIPGLGISVSAPWAAGKGVSSPKEGLKGLLGAPKGHTATFGELEWLEQDPREVEVEGEAGKQGILLRSYYTVVTLSTRASFKSFEGKEIGRRLIGRERSYFAHETSDRQRSTALLSKDPPHPRLWSAYSRREFSADPHLLDLVHEQVARGESVPGLPTNEKGDGDGGAPTYFVGLLARVQPWRTGDRTQGSDGAGSEPTDGYDSAGFVGVDVVAARVGHGRVLTEGSAGQSGMAKAWRKVMGKEGQRQALDLDDPPEGFYSRAVSARLGSLPGNLPLLGGDLEFAQRGMLGEIFPNQPSVKGSAAGPDTSGALSKLLHGFRIKKTSSEPVDGKSLMKELGFSDTARFALSANLRAGALVRGSEGGKVTDMLPIDAYAQWVIKMTVAMVPDFEPVTAEEAIAPKPEDTDVVTTGDKKNSPLEKLGLGSIGGPKMMLIIAVIGGIVLLGLAIAFPGPRKLVNAVFERMARVVAPKRAKRAKRESKDNPEN